MKNFWRELPKPFFAAAPMEGVTDTVFRQIIAKAGSPDVFFTEFTSTDGMCSEGRERVGQRLLFTPIEQPLIAQIWGTNSEFYKETTKMIVEMGFQGIDINMGCPVKDITTHGSCAALIQNPKLAKELFLATKEAAGDLPVSIKTRIGYNTIQTEEWLGFLLSLHPDALTIHGRTRKEMSKVPAHWDEIGKVVKMRDQMKSPTIIIGNGDVLTREEGLEKVREYGVDGIMIGRGIFQNLWVFNKEVAVCQSHHSPRHSRLDRESDPRLRKDDDVCICPTTKQKLELMIEHINLFQKTRRDSKPLEILKKFYKVYVSDFPNASEVRMELMNWKTPEETISMVRSLINNL